MACIQQRKAKDGKVHYRVQVRLKGYPVQTATFSRKTDAKDWAKRVESAIKEGRHFPTTEARKHTFSELVDRYIAQVLPRKPKSIKKQTAQLLWWREEIGAYALPSVTPALIRECCDKLFNGTTYRHEKRSGATTNRYLAVLSHAFTVAINEWEWIQDNPVKKISRYKESNGRTRFLSDEECDCLLASCKESRNKQLYNIVVVAVSTGMRLNEVLQLQWKDVNLERGRVMLNETKNGEVRSVPLKGHAHALVKRLKEERRLDTHFLFPRKDGTKPMHIRSSWEKALERAEVSDFNFHDLRHSTASFLAMDGASRPVIEAVLGHKSSQVSARYIHLLDSHTDGAVEKMNEKHFAKYATVE